MAQSFLILLREGFEAALIVAIVLAYLRSIGRLDLRGTIWTGVAVATGLSLIAGLVLNTFVDGLEGNARMRTFAVICIAAAAVLVWMVFWMRRQSMHIKGELQHAVDHAITEGTAARALFLVAFFAVLREGIETALFMVAAVTDDAGTGEVVGGGALGLLVAAALGIAIYQGGRWVPLRQFFRVTGFLVILFAAGLAARAVMFLQSTSGLHLGSWNTALYDITSVHWLTTQSEVGKFLAGIFGWDPRPSIEQALVWLVLAVPLTYFFMRKPRPTTPAPAVVAEATRDAVPVS